MEFDFFLWPMVLSMIFPILYSLKYKKEFLKPIFIITFSMFLIIILYWPLVSSNLFSQYTYIVSKFFIFVLLPAILLLITLKDKIPIFFQKLGLTNKGLKNSLMWCSLFIPIMLIVTLIIQFYNGVHFDSNLFLGSISFFESFTEEFFFRGILFIYLLAHTNLKVAYITSLASFVLMHPQHITTLFIIPTIIQGILTIEICRRSKNMIGAWILHGVNRFFIIVIIPLIL